jgi:hypothetical protein
VEGQPHGGCSIRTGQAVLRGCVGHVSTCNESRRRMEREGNQRQSRRHPLRGQLEPLLIDPTHVIAPRAHVFWFS